MALDAISVNNWNTIARRSTKAFLIVVFSINMICLPIACIKPAGIGRIKITEKIHELNNLERLNVIYSPKNNPYSPWRLTANFYMENNATFIKTNSFTFTAINTKDTTTRTVLVFTQGESQNPKIHRIIESLNMKEVCKSVPDFMIPFLKIYGYATDDIIIAYSDV